MSGPEYKATLDESEVLRSLENIEKEINGTTKSFEAGGKSSALALGAITGTATVLVDKIIQLGQVAVTAFANIIKGGVEINQRLEDTGKVFTAVFGDPNVGKQVVDFLNDTADKLNINRDLALSFGRSILPRTDSLETFTELLRLTDIQADTTGKSVEELSFAIREALTGDFISIRDQFDLSKESVERIKELTPALGPSAALAKVLGEEFEKLGKINVSGTLTTDVKALQTQFSELQQILGEPVFETFKEIVAEIGDVLNDREVEFKALALSAGELASAVVELIATGLVEFLQNIDASAIAEYVNQVTLLVENIDNLLRVTGLWTDTVDKANEIINDDISLIKDLSAAIETAVQLYILFKAGIAGVTGGQEAFEQSIKDSLAVLKEQNEELAKSTGGTDATAKGGAVDQKLQELNAEKEATDEVTEATEDATEATEEAIAAEEKLSTATTKTTSARSEAAKAEKEVEKARDAAAKTKEKIAEAEEDLQADILKAQKEAQQKLIEVEIETAQKREDIARQNAERIADIHRKNRQDIADAATDLSREEQDIATKAAREREDLERELAKKSIEIEENTKNQLKRIQEDFNRDATAAERNRDAIAFLAAVERKDQAVTEAKEKRDSEIETLKVEGDEKRAELERQRQEELEDARLANQRKLQDLQQSLQRELDEARIARERDLEEIKISEERKREAIQASLDAQLEQLRAAHEERLAELKQQLEEELAAIQAATARARSGGGGGGSGRGSSAGRRSGIAGYEQFNRARQRTRDFATASGFFGRRRRFAEGGSVLGLSPILVGDANDEEKGFIDQARKDNPELFVGNSGAITPVGVGGPEIFTPPETGRIIPNDGISAFLRDAGQGQGVQITNQNQNMNLGILDPSRIDTIVASRVGVLVRKELEKVMK